MKRNNLILVILVFAFILTTNGCQNIQQNEIKTSEKQKTLSELQIEACNSADMAKTCDTRLPEIGIVLKEDCCEALGKCC